MEGSLESAGAQHLEAGGSAVKELRQGFQVYNTSLVAPLAQNQRNHAVVTRRRIDRGK